MYRVAPSVALIFRDRIESCTASEKKLAIDWAATIAMAVTVLLLLFVRDSQPFGNFQWNLGRLGDRVRWHGPVLTAHAPVPLYIKGLRLP